MQTRKIGGIIIGAATLIVIGISILKIVVGTEVGFQEVIAIGTLLMMFFATITVENKEAKEGVLIKEELGLKISEQSSKISYFVLLFFILVAVAADQLVNGTINGFLLGILGLAMIILPIINFFITRRYQ